MIVLYAVDDSMRHHRQLVRSIASVRRHNGHISIEVHAFTPEITGLMESLSMFNARLVEHRRFRALPPGYLKWLAIKSSPSDTLLYLDTDTYCLGDPLAIRRPGSEFVARVEEDTRRNCLPSGTPGVVARQPFDRGAYSRLLVEYGAVEVPVFSTGIIFLDGRARREIAANDSILFDLAQRWRRGHADFPAASPRLAVGIASSIVLGVSRIEASELDPAQAPSYLEYLAGEPRAENAIVHMCSTRHAA